MDPQRWKQIDELLNAALDIEPDQRAAFLNLACPGDEDLRKEVESLLASDKNQQNSLEAYPKQVAADWIESRTTEIVGGTSVGPYKIDSMIGSGGMGEVYRASDSRIGREVALKILPAHFSQDSDRLRRFQQEAQAAGMLNHPNIVAIYDTGTHNGGPYLVSELLQGEVLQQKLSGHSLPIRKAIDYATQIAKGLSAAHEKGIIHRDLKPGNIFITKEGRVKILDFGLAKLTHPDAPPSTNTEQTETGVVLGTIVYMSPEQVTGKKVDSRSDIFAFGSLFYEMLCGKRPFSGETQIETMHAILKSDPADLYSNHPEISPAVERIVRRCLEKDPSNRFQTASDLAFTLESLYSSSAPVVQSLHPIKRSQLAWLGAISFFISTAVLGVALYRSSNNTPNENIASVQRFSIVLPPGTILNSLALSPDGHHIAYVTNTAIGLSKLWLRSIDSNQAEEIPGTENAAQPFWSPDGRSIGFFTENALKKWTMGGGPPEKLHDAEIPKGGAWNQYGDILFSPRGPGGLYRISSRGGEIKPATTLDSSRAEGRHIYPQFLPDGRHFLFLVNSIKVESRGVFIGSLDSNTRIRILPELTPVRYADPGFILFVRNQKLMLQQFDAKLSKLIGEPLALADNNSGDGSGPVFSAAGTNLIVHGNSGSWNTQPVWLDRSGKQSSPYKNYQSALGEPAPYTFCDMSSDDKRLLTLRRSSNVTQFGHGFNTENIMWMVDLTNGSFTRYAMTNESDAVFSPDGTRVAYSAFNVGPDRDTDLYIRSADGTGRAELLFHPQTKSPISNLFWSTDGRFLTFTSLDLKTHFDLWVLPLEGARKPFPYLQSPAREERNVFSPDGKWVAYQSYQTGEPEIYVRSFPAGAGGVWAISTEGGEQPIWRRDGKELFYLTPSKKLKSIEVQTGAVFKTGRTHDLFQMPVEPRMIGRIGATKQYFASADGRHFLVNTIVENKAPAEIYVLVNWKSLLK